MAQHWPHPLRDIQVSIDHLLDASNLGPITQEWDFCFDAAVRRPGPLDPDGDGYVWLTNPLPADLNQPFLGGLLTARQVQQAAIQADTLTADRRLGAYVQQLGLPARVMEVWPMTEQQLQDRVTTLTALLCAWALVCSLIEGLARTWPGSPPHEHEKRMLRALTAPGAIAADHVIYRMTEIGTTSGYDAALYRASRQRARALSMLITCRQALQQLREQQLLQSAEQQQQLFQLTIQQQTQQLYELRAQLDASMSELHHTRDFYQDVVDRMHGSLSTLMRRHDRIHQQYRRLQHRHYRLRERVAVHAPHLLDLAHADPEDDDQQQQDDDHH
jgi:hypothetical protein